MTGEHSPAEVTSVMVQVNGNGYSIEASPGDAKFQYVDLWSSPWTWGGNPPPGDGTLVVIKKGQTVVLDQNTASLKALLIQGEFISSTIGKSSHKVTKHSQDMHVRKIDI
ncbi:fibrocystin-L-like [Mytilus galloprovincialis]|uniref:fibrocystin-L-like n=1 Tax=Mytilus galloprovincialis TaxID=29158 RepID=UPI003F7B8B9A